MPQHWALGLCVNRRAPGQALCLKVLAFISFRVKVIVIVIELELELELELEVE